MNLVEIKDLSISFGGIKAVSKVNFEIKEGEILGLIGPNGAGKTTVFNLLTAVYLPTSGEILLRGKKLKAKSTDQAVCMGLARTFQNIRLFKDMSVLDNVICGMHKDGKYSLLTALLRLPSYWQEEAEKKKEALKLLSVFKLEEYAQTKASNLAYGQQRKLEICRALASKPELLLLDEPAAGMNATETKELMETIVKVRDEFKISVLLIEHDMNLVMGVCERLVVLDYGKVLATGKPQEIQKNKKVIGAYLGSEGAESVV